MQDIRDLTNAIVKCKLIYKVKCTSFELPTCDQNCQKMWVMAALLGSTVMLWCLSPVS